MTDSLKTHIRELEEAHVSLKVRESPVELDKLLADDFWEIGSSGIMYDKKDCLDLGVVLSQMTLHNYAIQQLAEDVVLSTYFIEDHTRKRNTLRSSIWKFIDDRWQLYFHQGTITQLQVKDLT
ncbi:hypothetical protein SAMN05216353_1026 [Halobacillus alkaliphilus]|uniref:DUF4440 domain-containing protein n=1 Tax=Halobacillus alkaliphilus TaxID=396056 RepID=A0A1I2JUN3_9BACI|nr:DUF4440 domain-containing protein [Halobacillus alkaliphilus]SFF56837.1 hypothetical protein SAMN05216353_1026 [Halobacillus alkaliphilus]